MKNKQDLLVNNFNTLDKTSDLNMFKRDYLLSEYYRKIKMNPFNTEGLTQFLRSVRDFIIPTTVSVEMRNDLLEFLNLLNEIVDNMSSNGEIEKGNYRFYIHSGFRPYNYQEKMYNQAVDKSFTAKPGYSEHQTGLAIDFGLRNNNKDCDLRDEKYKKLVDIIIENAADYGFILRYPNNKEIFTGYPEEIWHYRYVGSKEIAHEIMDNDLTLEEYFIANYIIQNNLFEQLENGSIDYSFLIPFIGEDSTKLVIQDSSLLDGVKNYISGFMIGKKR